MKPKATTDAKGQFAQSKADRKSTGVHSAKPTVIARSEDATMNRVPPGGKKVKDWDVHYDIADVKEDNDQG